MIIRKSTIEDALSIALLAIKLWPDNTLETLAEEFQEMLMDDQCAVFLLYTEDNGGQRSNGKPIGFAQCQLRHDYVEGTESSPVGYLEGIFVDEAYRRQGYARMLLAACEQWAQEMGCTEFASDCELDNETSLAFHLRMGFVEANRIICFTKSL